MGRLKRFIAEVLGFDGWKVVEWFWVKWNGVRYKAVSNTLVPPGEKLVIVVARRWMGRCSECGRRCRKVHAHAEGPRTWHDLPWCDHPVDLEYGPDRLSCRHCQSGCVELLPWADRYQRETRRLLSPCRPRTLPLCTASIGIQCGVRSALPWSGGRPRAGCWR